MPLTVDAILAGAEAGQNILVAESHRRALLDRHANERRSIEEELRAIERRRAEVMGLQSTLNDRHENERSASSRELQAASERMAVQLQKGAADSGLTPAAVGDVFERQRVIFEQAGIYGSVEQTAEAASTGEEPSNVTKGTTPSASDAGLMEGEAGKPSRRARRMTGEPASRPADPTIAAEATSERPADTQDLALTHHASDLSATPDVVEDLAGGSAPISPPSATEVPAADTDDAIEDESPSPLALTPVAVEILGRETTNPAANGATSTGTRESPDATDESPTGPADWFADVKRIATGQERPAVEPIDEAPAVGSNPSTEPDAVAAEIPQEPQGVIDASEAPAPAPSSPAPTAEPAVEEEDAFEALARQFGGTSTVPFEIPEALKR
jgi:hypothetical protein